MKKLLTLALLIAVTASASALDRNPRKRDATARKTAPNRRPSPHPLHPPCSP